MLGFILPQFASAKTQAELFDSLDCDTNKKSSQLNLLSLLVENDNDLNDSLDNEMEFENKRIFEINEKKKDFYDEENKLKNEKKDMKYKNYCAILESFIEILKQSEFLHVKTHIIDVSYDEYNSDNDSNDTIDNDDNSNNNHNNNNKNNNNNDNNNNNNDKNVSLHINTQFKFSSTLAQSTILSLSLESQNANVHSQVSTYLKNEIVQGYHRIPHGMTRVGGGNVPHGFTVEGQDLPHGFTRRGSDGGGVLLSDRSGGSSDETLGGVGYTDLPHSISHDSNITNDIYNINTTNNSHDHKNDKRVSSKSYVESKIQ
jgi:hypothetical protein